MGHEETEAAPTATGRSDSLGLTRAWRWAFGALAVLGACLGASVVLSLLGSSDAGAATLETSTPSSEWDWEWSDPAAADEAHPADSGLTSLVAALLPGPTTPADLTTSLVDVESADGIEVIEHGSGELDTSAVCSSGQDLGDREDGGIGTGDLRAILTSCSESSLRSSPTNAHRSGALSLIPSAGSVRADPPGNDVAGLFRRHESQAPPGVPVPRPFPVAPLPLTETMPTLNGAKIVRGGSSAEPRHERQHGLNATRPTSAHGIQSRWVGAAAPGSCALTDGTTKLIARPG
jgi:hypothetical protein